MEQRLAEGTCFGKEKFRYRQRRAVKVVRVSAEGAA